MGVELFGRTEILTAVDEITHDNVVRVLNRALAIHESNSAQIDYLYRYMRGQQPVLERSKQIRPEICNKVVENHAAEIAQFTSGYFMGEPVTYVRRGDTEESIDAIDVLNGYMFDEDKASHDMNLATWMAVCGVGYRMILPDEHTLNDVDECPFEIDTPDPRTTFVVYNSGFGKRRMMGVRQIWRMNGDNPEMWLCGYTKTHYFEVYNGSVRVWQSHALGDIPIFEYRLNMQMMGSFEPALPLLDAINNVMSNRVDGVEQFVQSFMKFKNCEIDEHTMEKLRANGAIAIKSAPGVDSDVTIIAQELNQTQTQTVVDYLYDQVLVICGLPTTTKGGKSTSDTGAAVLLRDGWTQCEARARDTELLFKQSERQFLKLALRIMRDANGIALTLKEIECKFTRRQHDNLMSKSQALLQMLEGGIHPSVAIATCGLFNDPMDVYTQSLPYLEKWKFMPVLGTDVSKDGDGDGVVQEFDRH